MHFAKHSIYKAELERGECPIETLAFLSGYSSGCTFARAFKEVLGEEPSEYRKRTSGQSQPDIG